MGAPVKNTCPDIDAAIRSVRSALKIAHNGMKMFEKRSDEWDMFDDIDTELRYLEGQLEDLRKANAALRDWGHELDEEVKASADTIWELEQKIEELEKQTA